MAEVQSSLFPARPATRHDTTRRTEEGDDGWWVGGLGPPIWTRMNNHMGFGLTPFLHLPLFSVHSGTVPWTSFFPEKHLRIAELVHLKIDEAVIDIS